MRFALLIFILSLVLLTSGCIRETGDVVINFTEPNVSEQDVSPGLPEEAEEAPEEPEPAENVTEPEEPTDPCAGVVCEDSITTCPDGTAMTCENTCDNETGSCTACIPDCTGHEAVEEDCELECGECEYLDEEDCECVTVLGCDGNGICEKNEWPSGQDCEAFEECDDEDDCTLDVFNFNQQACTHVEICCDDSDDCTLDEYNYTAQACQHTYICCGNGVCEPENNETEENCPEDCFEEGEEPGDVLILAIDAVEELVVLEGYGIDMANWTLEDAGPNFIYTFPEWFIIDGKAYLHRGYGEDNGTDLYWQNNRYVWNNDHDNATLRNSLGEEVSFYEY
jgi:hypothetical protein